MSSINKESIYDALRHVIDATSGKDPVSAGMVSSLVIKDGQVGFALEINPAEAAAYEPLRVACEKAVAALPGVARVMVVLTGNSAPTAPAKKVHPPIPGVRHIIAVASGKGGVGKSTVSVNLAVALAEMGFRIGLADADIYGPSVPGMLGLKQKPEIIDNKMVPLKQHGIVSVSMGYLLPDDVATIWRGPMATKALYQLLRGTHWGELDALIIDMPPGTGDIQLSLAENYPVSGAVLVSTPQAIALLDVRKALTMLRKVHIPLWGMIENMSGPVFGEGGAKQLAEDEQIPFLGTISLDPLIRQEADQGRPAIDHFRQAAQMLSHHLTLAADA